MKVWKSSEVPRARRAAGLGAAGGLALSMWAAPALATSLAATGLPEPLTALAGDPAKGLGIAQGRDAQCALCHAMPGSTVRQGNLGPGLQGVAQRLSPAMLRLRLVDSRLINPSTLMPAYHSTQGLSQVGQAWAGQTVLSAQDIEHVLAYLLTLD
jgi:sulfur-oxidizing protein SoxX